MPTASALPLRFAATVAALLTSSCLNWSRFHGPDASDAGTDIGTVDANDALDDLATTDADASVDDIAAADGDATMLDVAIDRVCTTSGAPDYCATISSLSNAPVLDGVLECGVPLQRFTAADYYPVNGPLPSGLVASFATAWRPEGLYVYGELHGSYDDPAVQGAEGVYCGDDFEIYVDSDGMYAMQSAYDTTGTRQILLSAPPRGMATGGFAQIYRDRMLQPQSLAQWTSRRVAGVVYFEALVTAADLGLATWSVVASQRVGFDVGITLGTGTVADAGVADAGSCHHLLGHLYFRLAPGDASCPQPSCNTSAFCAPTLAP